MKCHILFFVMLEYFFLLFFLFLLLFIFSYIIQSSLCVAKMFIVYLGNVFEICSVVYYTNVQRILQIVQHLCPARTPARRRSLMWSCTSVLGRRPRRSSCRWCTSVRVMCTSVCVRYSMYYWLWCVWSSGASTGWLHAWASSGWPHARRRSGSLHLAVCLAAVMCLACRTAWIICCTAWNILKKVHHFKKWLMNLIKKENEK